MTTEDQPPLFDRLPESLPRSKFVRPQNPVWTENKAKLIELYLYYFVLVTKHGTCIDGFAGPQQPGHEDKWAARLVLESEPRWLRNFFLFDKKPRQVLRLKALKDKQPDGRPLNRRVHVYEGDFNKNILTLMADGTLPKNEATFCLLDQRTFQCRWSTVQALSRYKGAGVPKIEVFYFLATGWLRRAICGIQNTEILRAWWGRDDWPDLLTLGPEQIKDEFVERFRSELGYKSATPWPIFKRQDRDYIMYYMIHATDDEKAPALMSRAYRRAVQPKESPEQFLLALDDAKGS